MVQKGTSISIEIDKVARKGLGFFKKEAFMFDHENDKVASIWLNINAIKETDIGYAEDANISLAQLE